RTLLAHAARTVVHSAMELGGNAPFVVLADADLDAAIAGAMVAKLRNGGSACTAANRVIGHESIAGTFAAGTGQWVGGLVVGPGLQPESDIGPLVNASTRDKVASLVQGALDAGAKPLIGAEVPDRRGFYYLPTVLTNVAADADIVGEEIFGPVAPVTTF